jgi:hypothetical protein
VDLNQFLDIHIRCGLLDEVVRISRSDYEKKITLEWLLSREDIIIRGELEDSECVIVLRGTDNARIRVQKAQRRAIPLFHVLTSQDVKENFTRAALRKE